MGCSGVRLTGHDEELGIFRGKWRLREGSEQGVMGLFKMRKGRETETDRQRSGNRSKVRQRKEDGQRPKSGKTDILRKRDTGWRGNNRERQTETRSDSLAV